MVKKSEDNGIKIGCHVSIAGGLFKAPEFAKELECEAFQIFSRSPRGGTAPPITKEISDEFKKEMDKCSFTDFVIHGPYIINFGSGKASTYHGSINLIRQDLERGSQIGAKYVMFHVGSGKDLGQEKAMEQAKIGIQKVLEGYEGTTQLLLENSAGAGEVLGDSFEELAELMEPLKKYKTFGGICYDTQHAFASGYDIRTEEAVQKTFKHFDKTIGLKYLKCFQINDSKTELGSHKDRHEHIEEGLIGKKGMAALIAYLTKKKWSGPLILETEHDKVQDDINILKTLRNKVKTNKEA